MGCGESYVSIVAADPKEDVAVLLGDNGDDDSESSFSWAGQFGCQVIGCILCTTLIWLTPSSTYINQIPGVSTKYSATNPLTGFCTIHTPAGERQATCSSLRSGIIPLTIGLIGYSRGSQIDPRVHSLSILIVMCFSISSSSPVASGK